MVMTDENVKEKYDVVLLGKIKPIYCGVSDYFFYYYFGAFSVIRHGLSWSVMSFIPGLNLQYDSS